MSEKKSKLYKQIYDVVKRIPQGRVATYGQVARVAGLGRQARLVGYALHNLPEGNPVPWHRVINAQGRISLGSRGDSAKIQRDWLEDEGVEFDQRGRVDLEEYRWDGEVSDPEDFDPFDF